jgi:TolA-binding protein
MKLSRRCAGFVLAGLLLVSDFSWAQEVRRAQPFIEPPVPRALPVDESTPPPEERSSTPEQPSDKRQLEYANALFARKMYDLAIPEYERYLSDYGSGSGRANAYFGLGESYRLLGKNGSARTNFQKVLDDFGDSEFAGPAA